MPLTFAVLTGGVAAWGLADWAIALVALIAVVALVVVYCQWAGVTVPPALVKVFWIVVGAVVVIAAIRLVLSA